MKLNLFSTILIAAAALALPIGASAGTNLNLDTGAAVGSGGDIGYTGSGIAPQGNAALFPTGAGGAVAFAEYSQAILSELGAAYTKTAITGSSLVVNEVIAVQTNGGNYAKLLITAVSSASISLQYQTYGGANASGTVTLTAGSSGGSGAPTITQILNNYGLVPAGFTNSGIAQGSLFIIKGSGLADPSAPAVLQSSGSPGLQTTLYGASVKVTVGSTTTVPVFYYALASQLALVMPSNTPVGSAQVTVTYNNQTSSPYAIQVVASAMGFDAYYGGGVGSAVATNNATGLTVGTSTTGYNYTTAVPPGTTIVLWGSGLGADPTRDTTYSTSNINQIQGLAHIYIGGIDAPILYQGPSGYPGVNQVNVTVPAAVTPGCNVALVGVSSSGVPTNFLSLPVGTGVCVDPTTGATGTQLQNGATLTNSNTGFVGLAQSTSSNGTVAIAEGVFESQTVSASSTGGGSVSVGGCVVGQTGAVSGGSTPTPTGLDAGTITVTGPNGTATLAVATKGDYFVSPLPSGFLNGGGTYTFNGSGGADVGKFSVALTFPNPPLVWSNTAADGTITRGSGATFNWSNGASGSYVIISGSSSATNGAFGSFTCIAPVAAGTFTVPAYVLSALPAGTGTASLSDVSSYTTFTATGINSGIGYGSVTQGINVIYN